MNAIQFKRYNPGGCDPVIVAERITHWYFVDYNGNYGTCIVLDTGKEVTVGEPPWDVQKKLAAAGWNIV